MGKSPFPVPSRRAPGLEEAVRLLRHSVFAWESMPDQPMRQLLRLGFFEPTSPPLPRLHTRWLGLAGESLPEGIGAVDLGALEFPGRSRDGPAGSLPPGAVQLSLRQSAPSS